MSRLIKPGDPMPSPDQEYYPAPPSPREPEARVCPMCAKPIFDDETPRLTARVKELEAALLEAREAKDGAYSERDNLVAALSKLFPSALERHPDSDTAWENDWRWIVFIDLPTGQATWHIHDSELSMFDHLPRFTGRTWDGHTTPQKYLRLASLSSAPPTNSGGKMNDLIPVISLWQPWAQWVSLAWKPIETRTHKRFASLVGKRIGIHASLKWDKDALSLAHNYLESWQRERTAAFLRIGGAIICTALVKEFRLLTAEDSAKALIDCGTTQRYGLILTDVEHEETPPYKGRQGIWYASAPPKEKP